MFRRAISITREAVDGTLALFQTEWLKVEYEAALIVQIVAILVILFIRS
jgi:hypothetical protein